MSLNGATQQQVDTEDDAWTTQALGASALPARSQQVDTEDDAWITSCAEVAGVCVHAAQRTQIVPVTTPNKRRPPTSICVWYRYGNTQGGWNDPDGAVPVAYLIFGGLYVIDCHRVADGSRLLGYPSLRYHVPGQGIPGPAVGGSEVARYAVDRLDFESPVAAVWPAGRQLVGAETWFAVTSKLRNYLEKSAQAGSVWSTVRAQFLRVTWDLGPYGRLVCIGDAARRWNPNLSAARQRSNCTRTFERSIGSGIVNATVTASWRIYWASSEHVGWKYHSTYERSSTVRLDVRELQAVIR